LITLAVSVSLFGWLTFSRHSKNIDWSHPFSWTVPFFPMKTYPLRFWWLASESLLLAGGTAMIVDFLRDGPIAFGATFFGIGCGISGTLWIWCKTFGKNISTRQP
jgi:hypothetical protein